MKKVWLFIQSLFVKKTTVTTTPKPKPVVNYEPVNDENIERLVDLQEKPSMHDEFQPVYDFKQTNVERVYDAIVKLHKKGIKPVTSAMIYSELDGSISILSVRKSLYKLSIKNRIKEVNTENPDKSRTKYWVVK